MVLNNDNKKYVKIHLTVLLKIAKVKYNLSIQNYPSANKIKDHQKPIKHIKSIAKRCIFTIHRSK